MSTLLPFLLLLLLAAAAAAAQAQPSSGDPADAADSNTALNPSVAIIVGVFAIMFSLTFFLLLYAKFVHGGGNLLSRHATGPADDVFLSLDATVRASSGIDRSVVESLPFFRFSALGGRRDGLECAVCLSRFDHADVLRLLPKCKHAFHVGCVDRWLESHSTCPLCRHRIDPHDSATCSWTHSTRFLISDGADNNNNNYINNNNNNNVFQLFVERERERLSGGVDFLDKHRHKIVVSGNMFKGRWSDLNSSDLASLDAEMLRASSGEIAVKPSGSKCASEITSVSRFRTSGGGATDDDRVRRLWLPIAQRTMQLFAGRVRRPEDVIKFNAKDVAIV